MSKFRGKSNRQNTRETTEKDQIQDMRAIISEQKKEIQRLRRELNRRENVSEDYKELLHEVDLEPQQYHKKDYCPECGKGILKVVDLGIRRIIRCSICEYKKVQK